MAHSVPNYLLLKDFYTDVSGNLLKIISQKLRDSNRMQSNLNDPHLRSVNVPEVHRLVFAGIYANLFQPNEKEPSKCLEKDSPKFILSSQLRVSDVLSAPNTLKIHKIGDITLIAAWAVVTEDVNSFIQSGKLVIPIKALDQNSSTLCFVPCEGLDPDTEEPPSWAMPVVMSDIVGPLHAKDFLGLKKRANGTITASHGTDYVSIVSKQVEPGDFVYCRGEIYKVSTVGDDAFFPEGSRDILRLTSDIRKNINRQPFDIIRFPVVQGQIVELDSNSLDVHCSVSMQLTKITENNIGTLKITSKNACFNSFGFLTHDGYILMGKENAEI